MSGDQIPTVLCLSGLDPTGGAGLQADIETVSSLGCHALSILTANTVQDTRDVFSVMPVSAADILAQARTVIDDITPNAIKVGLVGSADVARAVACVIDLCPGTPVVVDPICSSGAGTPLADDELLDALINLLAPRASVLTPNSLEARLLSPGADSLKASAQELLSYGCEYVLITGTHEDTPEVEHQLYHGMRLEERFRYPRLPHDYHGSGCTLSAALAALLAHGQDPSAACSTALGYTWSSLKAGLDLGKGQRLPNRLLRSRDKAQ